MSQLYKNFNKLRSMMTKKIEYVDYATLALLEIIYRIKNILHYRITAA